MRTGFTLTLLFIGLLGFAQTGFLKDAVVKLDKALVSKDTTTLKQLLHKDVTFGHSNGWVQTKQDVIGDMFSGKLVYTEFENKDVKWKAAKDWASMRCVTEAKYLLDGKEGELKLHVLQVWIKTNKGWQLFARQSTKLN